MKGFYLIVIKKQVRESEGCSQIPRLPGLTSDQTGMMVGRYPEIFKSKI